MSSESKVGLFAIIGLILLGMSLYLLGNFSITNEYQINVEFSDVSGLPDKSIVRLSGVEVGKVRDIKILNGKVIAVLGIMDKVVVYRDAEFSIGSSSVIGSKYLRINQGTKEAGIIENKEFVRGKDVLTLEDMLLETLGNFGDDGTTGEQINATLESMRELSASLNQMILNMEPSMTGTMENLNALLEDLNSQEGALGALMNDPQAKEDVQATIKNVREISEEAKTLMGRVKKYKATWLFASRNDLKTGGSYGDFGLKISPRYGKYYRFGLANLGNKDDDPEKGTEYVEKNKVDVRFGFYNEWYDFSFGVVRGSGGANITFNPLYTDKVLKRLSVYGEIYDMSRNRVISGRRFNKANVAYGADLNLFKVLYVGVRMDDVLELNRPQITLGVQFDDEDVTALIGLIALAAAGSKG